MEVRARQVSSAARTVRADRTARARHGPAFTLIETLVVIAIISLLLSMLIPGLNAARDSMKKLKCASNMRTVAINFQFFADDDSADGQGDSGRLRGKRFYVNDFQDSLYRIDEFWDLGGASSGTLNKQDAPMLCAAGPAQLTKRKGYPCGREAISPVRDVTLAFNMRLYRAVIEYRGRQELAPVISTTVPARVLDHPYVPLVLDVDAEKAVSRGAGPFYIAPSRGRNPEDPYAGEQFWAPSDRHRGKTNVAFVGGHVLTSEEPARESWDWDYQASVGGR